MLESTQTSDGDLLLSLRVFLIDKAPFPTWCPPWHAQLLVLWFNRPQWLGAQCSDRRQHRHFPSTSASSGAVFQALCAPQIKGTRKGTCRNTAPAIYASLTHWLPM
eukprot:6194022-Amphidinium_carterae.1